MASAARARSLDLQLVVLVPFIESQVKGRLAPMMLRWREEQYAPCSTRRLPALLAFLSPYGRTRRSSGAELQQLWLGLGDAAACFAGGMEVLHAGLPDAIAKQHIDGSCAQFESAFTVLSGRARYFFLMEPDMLPIRPGWLGSLLAEVPAKARPASATYWVRGSVAQCARSEIQSYSRTCCVLTRRVRIYEFASHHR